MTGRAFVFIATVAVVTVGCQSHNPGPPANLLGVLRPGAPPNRLHNANTATSSSQNNSTGSVLGTNPVHTQASPACPKSDPLAELVAALTPILKTLAPVLESLAPALKQLGPVLVQLLGGLLPQNSASGASPPPNPLGALVGGLLGPSSPLGGVVGGLLDRPPSASGQSPVTNLVGSLVGGQSPVTDLVGSLVGGQSPVADLVGSLVGGQSPVTDVVGSLVGGQSPVTDVIGSVARTQGSFRGGSNALGSLVGGQSPVTNIVGSIVSGQSPVADVVGSVAGTQDPVPGSSGSTVRYASRVLPSGGPPTASLPMQKTAPPDQPRFFESSPVLQLDTSHCYCDQSQFDPICTMDGFQLKSRCFAICLHKVIRCSSHCPC